MEENLTIGSALLIIVIFFAVLALFFLLRKFYRKKVFPFLEKRNQSFELAVKYILENDAIKEKTGEITDITPLFHTINPSYIKGISVSQSLGVVNPYKISVVGRKGCAIVRLTLIKEPSPENEWILHEFDMKSDGNDNYISILS